MRVTIPENDNAPIPSLEQHYSPKIIAASNGFAMAIYKHSILPLRIFEAARITTAVINGCMVCKNWRTARDAKQMGIEGGVLERGPAPDEAFYKALLEGDNSNLSQREQLAVEYAKGMGQNPTGIAQDDDFWERFKAEFSDEEIVDLSYCMAAWMGLGRVAHVLGVDTACAMPS